MSAFKILRIGLVAAMFHGAFNDSSASLDEFEKNHPENYERYSILAATSLEYASFVSAELDSIIDSILVGMERRIGDPEAMQEYIERIRSLEFAKAFDLAEQEFAKHLKESDEILFFRYSEPGYSDYGILVLREGEIVFREPYGWSRHGHRDDSEEVSDPKKVDQL